MRAVVITIALSYLVIAPLMADPEPAPAPEGVQTSAFVPPAPVEAFKAPTKDKISVALDTNTAANTDAIAK